MSLFIPQRCNLGIVNLSDRLFGTICERVKSYVKEVERAFDESKGE